MTLPSKPVVIRLPAEANKKFEALCREFSGLPKSQVMRLLIEALLNEPLSEQVQVVTKQIRKPGTKPGVTKKPSERFEALNTNRRH
ncbi:MAG: hypothetical protein AMXMBFR7_48910 [Planctomycetota bacterium]